MERRKTSPDNSGGGSIELIALSLAMNWTLTGKITAHGSGNKKGTMQTHNTLTTLHMDYRFSHGHRYTFAFTQSPLYMRYHYSSKSPRCCFSVREKTFRSLLNLQPISTPPTARESDWDPCTFLF